MNIRNYKLIENIDEQFKYNCEKMDRIYKEALKDIKAQREKKNNNLSLGSYLETRNIAEEENQRQRSVNVDNHLADYQGD